MRSFRPLVAVAALLLLGGLNLATGAEKVLVPGDPPLTQKMLDQYTERWQWYTNIQLSDEQSNKFQRLLVAFWQKKGSPGRQALANGYARDQEKYTQDLRLQGLEQDMNRSQLRLHWTGLIRKDTEPFSRYATALYDEAYRPGGRNNPVLVKGDPPLTQGMIDLDTFIMEMMFDTRLSDEQRREFQQLWIDDWAKQDQRKKQETVKNLEAQADVPTWNIFIRNVKRSFNLPKNIERASKATDAKSRWLAATYGALVKPGSDRNPVLVDSKPPLTQLVVDRYRDYVEVMLDLRGDGFSKPQRQVFQDYMVKEWKTMTPDEREEQLTEMQRWFDAAGEGARGDEAVKLINALRPKCLVRLEADKRESSKWLLKVLADVREKEARQAKDQQMMFDAGRFIIRQMNGDGHWETRKGHVEWVPNK
jgi:hypothetical protein